MSVQALTLWIDNSVKEAGKYGYYPSYFQRMRADTKNDVAVIRKLVRSPDVQSGFAKLCKLGRMDLTMEHAVTLFPELFDRMDREWARARIELVKLGMDVPQGPEAHVLCDILSSERDI